MKKRIGVLGGSFDPVHLGHYALAKAALEELKLDKLIIIPANVQPFKQDWHVTPGNHRLNMLELAFSDEPRMEISDYELEHTDVSYTYDTLQAITENYPLTENEIIFVMGTDSLISFSSWYKGKTMLKMYSLAVSIRPGYREEVLYEKMEEYRKLYAANIYILESEMPDVSSTEFRKIISEEIVRYNESNDTTFDKLLDPKVLNYIRQNDLYQGENSVEIGV